MSRLSCTDCRELISAFVDGELSQDDRALLRTHLAGCEDCRQTLDAYRAIGGQVRSMPPVLPPSSLTDAIYAETVDAAPRRLFLITSRVGYSLAAVAAVVLIFVVAGYLLVGGYQRGITPEVAWSKPSAQQQWPTNKPIEISFNKDMDRDSVIAALAIFPTDEELRHNYAWDGNTLLIGVNQPLKAGSTYNIKITTDARDKWGNRLGQDFTLQFSTPSNVAQTEPTPIPPTPQITSGTPKPVTPTASAVSATAPVSPTRSSGTNATATSGAPSSGGNVQPSATYTPVRDPEPPATPTPEPTFPVIDPGDEPTPAATPTELPPTATPSPTPTQPAPTPTPTSPPADTPTPDTIAVTGAFGNVYWGYEQVRSRLGQPLTWAESTPALQLAFQQGEMFMPESDGRIYILFGGSLGVWSSFEDTADQYPAAEAGPEDGLWIPGGAFGYLWRSDSYTASQLGYAFADAASYVVDAQTQWFERGVIFVTPQTVYVVYGDGAWEFYPNVPE